MSRWHGPPGGEGSGGPLGPQRGTGAAPHCPRKQNGFEVFVLVEIGSPESNANNPEYLFLNEHHQFFLFPVSLFS